MIYEVELLQPISGTVATAIRRNKVDKINLIDGKLYFVEELKTLIGFPPRGITKITLGYQLTENSELFLLGEFIIGSASVFTRMNHQL